ncbi:VOC family protein [Salipaludibacillus daqingensis]|uniref:VOC family protein n=1 Tax=Salipaludibacillus daqingensis TaxID=3041001 RepID=UPI0024743FCB|nr:VOC family protein [Salipaludibacillus daqingensis]
MAFHQPPATYVREVSLKVINLQQTCDFYEKSLGLQLLQKTERSAVFTADGKTPIITLEKPDNVTENQPRTTGLYHFALLLPTRAELGLLLQHLIDEKYPLQGASDHLVSEAIYLADPEGNGIEIYIDRPPSKWEWNGDNVKMTVDPLDVEGLLSEAEGKVWSGIAPKTIMGHIHMHVANLDDAEVFYCSGLGFDKVSQLGDQALFLSSQDYHHHIGLNTWAGVGAPAPAKSSAGIHWFEIVYPSLVSREHAIENVNKLGFSTDKIEDEYYTVDPAGNTIKLSVQQK